MNSWNPCLSIYGVNFARWGAGGQRLPVPRNSRWHGCQQAPAAAQPVPWRKEAYKAYENGAAAAEVHGRRRHVSVIRIMPGILIIPSAPLQPHFPTAVEFLQCQSRAGRKWAQHKRSYSVELSEGGRKRHPDIQRDNIRGAGREGASLRGVPRSFGSRTRSPISTLTPPPPFHPCLANGEIP